MLALQYGTCQCFLAIVKRGDSERTAKLRWDCRFKSSAAPFSALRVVVGTVWRLDELRELVFAPLPSAVLHPAAGSLSCLLLPVSASHQEHNAGLWQRGDGRGSGAASAGEARLHHPCHPSVQQQPVPTPGPPGHEGLQKSKRLLFACSVEPKK